jgi:hypothetical protein
VDASPRLRLARVREDEAESDGGGAETCPCPAPVHRKLAAFDLTAEESDGGGAAGQRGRSTWPRMSDGGGAAGQRGRSTWPRMSDGGGAAAGRWRGFDKLSVVAAPPASFPRSSEIEPLLFFFTWPVRFRSGSLIAIFLESRADRSDVQFFLFLFLKHCKVLKR